MANEQNVPTAASDERKGLQASEVHPAFHLNRLADGSLAYDRSDATLRDWSAEAMRIGTCDHIGPFAQVRRSTLAGQDAGSALYGDRVLFESEDGQYSLFVPLNLLKPLFAHRWIMSAGKRGSLGVGASMQSTGMPEDRDPVEMELLESTRGGSALTARPSLSQLRSLLGGDFADLSPYFARADTGSLFGAAAGRPDLNFLRQAQAAVAAMPGDVHRVVPSGQPRSAPYKLEPGAELRVSTEPGRAEVVLQRPPQMPPGKVSVPFFFSGAGHLEYDASAPLEGSVKMGDGRPLIEGEHPTAHHVTLSLSAPQGLRRADGPHGPWDVRNAVDILAAPLEVSSWQMYVSPASRAGAPSAMRTTWSGSESRVVFDGDRYVPVAEVQRRARGAHSRSDYCPLNYVLGEDELLLDGVNVTSVLGGKGRFRDVSPHGGTHVSGLGLGAHGHFVSESSPEANLVKTVKEIAVERRRRAGAYKGAGSWGGDSAKLDTPESFDEKTGKKKDEKEIKRDTGAPVVAAPAHREPESRREAREAKPIGGWILEKPVSTPDVYYNVQYMLPTQAPLRAYKSGGGSEADEREKWEAWAGAGPEAVHLTRSSREPGGKYNKATDVSRADGAAGSRRPGARRPEAAMRADEAAAGDEGLFGRPGVRGGGSLAGGFNRPEAQFLFKGGMGSAAGTSGASAMLGIEGAAGSSMAGLGFAGSFAGAGLGLGGALTGSTRARAFPMSTARSDLSISSVGGGEALVRYRSPELTALRSTLQGAGYDLSAPPPRSSSEGFEATSHKRGLFAGGSGAGAGAGSDSVLGASRAHVSSGGSSRTVNLDPKNDLGFMPRGTESVGRFGGVTGGVAPSAAGLGEPAMNMVGGASGISRGLLAAGGGAMALGFGGAAVALGTSGSSGSDKTKKSDAHTPRGGEFSGAGLGAFASAAGRSGEGRGDERSLYLDYSPSDRTLYVSRFGKGAPESDRPDFGVHLPTGLSGSIKMSGTTREYAHTAKTDRSVPGGSAGSGGAGMAKGWVGGADGGGVTLGGASTGGAGLDAARMSLASGTGKAPGASDGAPPLSSDTMVKFMGPALSYQLGQDADGNNVLLYNGKMNASASGYPGAEDGLDFALPLGMERYSQAMVGDGMDGDLHVAWGGKDKKPGDVSNLEPLAGRKPGVYNFPLSATFSGGMMSGMFGSGIAGSKAQGLAGKARASGLEASSTSLYRGAVDGAISGRGPALSSDHFTREIAETARSVSSGLAGGSGPGGFGGGVGGLRAAMGGGGGGMGGGLGGLGGVGGLGGLGGMSLTGSGGGVGGAAPPGVGGPGGKMPVGPADGAAPGAAPGTLVSSGGMDAIRGKSSSFSTNVSLSDLASKGPAYGIRREDLVGMQKAFSSGGPGSGSYSMKAPGVDLVIVRPTTGKGDVAGPDSVIMNGKRVEAYTKSSMKNPASASSENKVNLDYEMIAREIYKRIKNLAALQRERRADDHMRYG